MITRLCAVLLLSTFTASVAVADADGAAPKDAELSLADIVQEALTSNLDLATQSLALAADREQIDLARAKLLPQIGLGAKGQILEDDRASDGRGATTQRSFTVGAGAEQIVYDENTWAELTIQKHVYAGQTQQFENFKLGLAEQAANAVLEFDLARALVKLQQKNKKITQTNIDTSRARIAAGWSSETGVLRWESQLASNDRDIANAKASVLVNLFALNSVRALPREAPVTVRSVTVEEYGFVYASEPIASALAQPEADRRMRDSLVSEGLLRSPTLKAVDEAIAAQERQLKANKRVFWIPTLSVSAGVDHLISGSSASENFNDTEWGIGGKLTFPLFSGGARVADLRQAQDTLASLRAQRRATIVTLGDGIRSAFAVASGTYAGLIASRKQQKAAERYFDLTNQSYVLGVASLLNLLDAQNQQLTADIAAANALKDFLTAVIASERALAFYPFLAPEAEANEILENIEKSMQITR